MGSSDLACPLGKFGTRPLESVIRMAATVRSMGEPNDVVLNVRRGKNRTRWSHIVEQDTDKCFQLGGVQVLDDFQCGRSIVTKEKRIAVRKDSLSQLGFFSANRPRGSCYPAPCRRDGVRTKVNSSQPLDLSISDQLGQEPSMPAPEINY